MAKIKTMTVDELIATLMKFPQDTRVFISRDEEGNGFGTIGESSEYSKLDKTLVFYPVQEHLEYEDIAPKEWQKEMKEFNV
jgi:hypothetical protein